MTEDLLTRQDCHFGWLDLTGPTVAELQAVAAQYDLPDSLVIDCLEPTHLPKFEATHGLNFVILRVFSVPDNPQADTIQELSTKIAIFYTPDYLITVHRRPHPVLNELKSVARTPGGECNSPVEVAIHLVRYALNSYVQPALVLTRQLDAYEAEIFLKREVPDALQGLYFLKRKASAARQLLLLTRDILTMLRRQSLRAAAGHELNEADAILLQDTQDLLVKVETLYQQLDNGATNLVNLYLSLASQRTNETMRVLTVFSAFFLPLTFIAGVYGMNFQYMPELTWQLGYPGAIGAMLLISVGIYWWFKRKGWI
ncbi:magnesium transporter CorA family protein [Hymenobacter cellulosivorans]|uniref:Magnesium transporter CorA n=1 Tax=Hymenobacter cellulosivorans TaxID=2932249 RepID=A0ABY4FEF5_9BACT|nr:CorA family divalent cation transporter [Hymenobacter cellulosivorans]UOQ54402.1 magnesium transporter CorA [Hymenobacter cellulosivorans]